MLAKLQDVVRHAQRRHYAVGAFNVSDLELAQAVIQAATEERSPVIVNTSPAAIKYAGLKPLAALIKVLAADAPVPVVLNLDHGKDLPLVRQCLNQGYTGIMFDGSRLSASKNIAATSRAVHDGLKFGIGVEGEIGQVKYVEDAVRSTGSTFTMTDPDEAHFFVQRTGIKAFAVAIGNAHGVPTPTEHLDFNRLAAIRRRVKVPLVLHGASGTPPNDIRRAIKFGIAKINIDTDLRLAFTMALRQTLRANPKMFDPRAELDAARSAVQKVVRDKMRLFGSNRQA